MKSLLALATTFGLAGLLTAAPAQAVTNFTLSALDGDPLQVNVTIQEVAGSFSSVDITLQVVNPPYFGDLQGAFFHISDESLLPGLTVTGTGLSGLTKSANNVNNLGGGNNVNGQVVNTYGKFDVGFTIGTPGIGSDDYMTFSFNVAHASANITESLFEGLPFAVRATSVGTSADSRGGSSKLVTLVTPPDDDDNNPGGDPDPDPTPSPEPATAVLGGMTLVGLAIASRRRR